MKTQEQQLLEAAERDEARAIIRKGYVGEMDVLKDVHETIMDFFSFDKRPTQNPQTLIDQGKEI